MIDDGSDDYGELKKVLKGKPKVRIFRHEENMGGYLNKIYAVDACKNDWVIILDSDNWLSDKYLDSLYSVGKWSKDVLYFPERGEPRLNYSVMVGDTVNSKSIGYWLSRHQDLTKSLLNTGNYFVNKSMFLEVADPEIGKKGHIPCSIAFTFQWIKKGFDIQVIKGLTYTHTIRKNSYWRRNAESMKKVVNGIIKDLLGFGKYEF